MIKIENSSLFGFETYISDDLVLVNITVDPEVVELKSYRRTPFASIVIRSESLPNEIEKINKSENDKVKKKELFNIINEIVYNSKLTLYNSFVDSEYDKYKTIFDNTNLHTIILFVEDGKLADVDDNTILIGGFPVRGMVSPINKSADYKLLNGSFISTKMFTMKLQCDEYESRCVPDDWWIPYDKLLYVYVDIKTKFEFHVYRQITETIGIGNDNIFIVSLSEDFIFPTIINKSDVRKIPIKGREYLFQKPDKNMFHLSDVPKDIIMKKHQLSREI